MLNHILKQIKPSKEEEKNLNHLTNQILNKIKIPNTKPIIGGSLAKDTWLKDTHDVDIFVKFNLQKYKNKNLSNILSKALRKKFKLKKLKGSRDYFQIQKNNYTFEIVPILGIKKASQARNITDISPLHATYVKKHKKSDQVRLTKAFTKAQNLYGAESYIQGFSGYVLEILTIHYGSFNNLIKSASKWKQKTILDPKKQLKNPLKELNKSKTRSPLILVDPVDKTRNAASALSNEKYNLFIKTCKSFIKKPSEKYFIKKIEKIPKDALVIEIQPEKGKKDSVGGKLRALFNKIEKQLNLQGFKVKKSSWLWEEDKAYFWFKLKNNSLPKLELVKGPPIKDKKNLIKFKKKHKKITIKNKIAYSKKQRKYTKSKDFLKGIIKQKGIHGSINQQQSL